MGLKHAIALGICLGVSACAQHARAPVYDLKQQGRSSGAAIVGPRDSAASLANRYELTIEDIIAMNGGRIYAGQHVQLPPPRSYRARTGDTVQSVASMFDMQASDVIAQNHLSAPYTLQEGQTIYLTRQAVTSQTQVAHAMPPMTVAPPSAIGTPMPHGNGMFAAPVQGRVISSYGQKDGGRFNDGINIAATPGSAVGAAQDGTVVYAGNKLSGYGNLVLIRHADGYFTVYSHMASTRVAKGVQVTRGQTIGTVGVSGLVKTPQLHFEIRKGTQSLDPAGYL